MMQFVEDWDKTQGEVGVISRKYIRSRDRKYNLEIKISPHQEEGGIFFKIVIFYLSYLWKYYKINTYGKNNLKVR